MAETDLYERWTGVRAAHSLSGHSGKPKGRDAHSAGAIVDLQETAENPAFAAIDDEIGAADVEPESALFDARSSAQVSLLLDLPLRDARKAFERAYFEQLLARGSGSVARAAEKCGLERTHLYRKLKALGITACKKDEAW